MVAERYSLAGAWYELSDESRQGVHLVELERADTGELVTVRVDIDETDLGRIVAVSDASSAGMWVLGHVEECARACMAAEYRGLPVDAFSQVWRPGA